jgi:hypothetical protein
MLQLPEKLGEVETIFVVMLENLMGWTCVWRIADSGRISNSPHTRPKPLSAGTARASNFSGVGNPNPVGRRFHRTSSI